MKKFYNFPYPALFVQFFLGILSKQSHGLVFSLTLLLRLGRIRPLQNELYGGQCKKVNKKGKVTKKGRVLGAKRGMGNT